MANAVDEAWRKCLAELGNNMIMDSPMGKTVFACGIAFAVSKFTDNLTKEELDRLRLDFEEFVQAYMRQR